MMWFVGHRSISPSGESLLALPKSNQKASPCTPLLPPVLPVHTKAGGTRQRHTKASLSLRTVCADDASTTARCSAPRRGLKGRLVRKQLCGESLASYGLERVNRYLSILGFFCDLALIEWAFQEKADKSRDAATTLRGPRNARSARIKFNDTEPRNSDAGIRATLQC